MRRTRWSVGPVARCLVFTAGVMTLAGCLSAVAVGPAVLRTSATAGRPASMETGNGVTVRVLTYNVAGLPDFISSSHPSANHSVISPLLNNFDLVLVQEDFRYHDDLSSRVSLPYHSSPTRKGLFGMGDGLNRFSASPFEDHQRVTWKKRHGVFRHSSDRLAPKGFSVATHRLPGGLEVDVYNLHMDAGGHPGDSLARRSEIAQLTRAITELSGTRALIVAGDWNLAERRPEDIVLLEGFMETLSLQDARVSLGLPGDRIDRILYRSGETVEIVAVDYGVETRLFSDGAGAPLSDHEAVSAEFLIRPADYD